jgi:hypothetical protein
MPRRPSAGNEDQLREFFDKLNKLAGEAVLHGFYHLDLRVEKVPGGDRDVVIDAGKKFKFRVRDLNLADRVRSALTPEIGAESSVRDREERGYQ